MELQQPFVANKLFHQLLVTLVPKNVPLLNITAAMKLEDVLFLDAREPEEYAVSHIKNAIPVGYKNFDLATLEHIDKSTRLVVYCSVGWRSAKIATHLINAGYTQVYNLYGGLFEWVNGGGALYCGNVLTKSLHVYSKAWSVWVTKRVKKIV